MRALSRIVCLLGLLTALGLGRSYWQLSNPALDLQPLPAGLIALPSAAGQQLLASAEARADYESLQSHFTTQQKGSWCGVATGAIVLSALGRATTQDSFFDERTRAVRSFWAVTFGGMTLDDFGRLLEAHGARVEVHHAAAGGIDEWRDRARRNLDTPNDFVVVNYQRAALGQSGDGGHLSPLAAYDAASDRFLILDVASYRYPPTWVPAASLWEAMSTIDSDSGTSRGYALVSASG